MKIVSSNITYRGRSISIIGKMTKDVLPKLKRKTLDVNVEVCFKSRQYGKKRSSKTRIFRFLAIYNENKKKYHFYLTNIKPQDLTASDIQTTYALRWQVEIIFKALKQHHSLEELPSSNIHIVKCLIWASILALIASQTLYRLIREQLDVGRFIPLLRWAARFGETAQQLLLAILSSSSDLAAEAFGYLERHAPDPNIRRADRALNPVFPDLFA